MNKKSAAKIDHKNEIENKIEIGNPMQMLGVKENLKKPKSVAPDPTTSAKPSIVKASQKSDLCVFCKEKMKSGPKLNHEMTVN